MAKKRAGWNYSRCLDADGDTVGWRREWNGEVQWLPPRRTQWFDNLYGAYDRLCPVAIEDVPVEIRHHVYATSGKWQLEKETK